MKLEELLELYNFRLYRDDLQKNKENTDVIRIYLNCDTWFEFGIDDLGETADKKEQLHTVLHKELLDREVEYIHTEDVTGMLLIYLKEKEDK